MLCFFGGVLFTISSAYFLYNNKYSNTVITNYINKVCNSSLCFYMKEKLGISYLKQESRHSFSLIFFHEGKKYVIPLEKLVSDEVFDVFDEKNESVLEKYINHTAFIEDFRIKTLDELPNVKYLVKVI